MEDLVDTNIDRRGLLGAAAIAIMALALPGGGAAAAGSGRFPVTKSAAEWRRLLGPKRYHILREAGTERPYSSALNKEKRSGRYH